MADKEAVKKEQEVAVEKKERIIKEVPSISHNWFVVDKKRIHKTNYYLLRDCKLNDKGRIEKKMNVFLAVAESLEAGDRFTGRIMNIADIEKVHEKIIPVANGRVGTKDVKVKEPYIHHLNDYGSVTDAEAASIFGSEYVGFTLTCGQQKENLLYNSSPKDKE